MAHDVSLIAAVGRSGQLGLNGRLPWHEPEDLAFFRRMTMGHVVVVGFSTSRQLPDLDGRTVHIAAREEQPEDVMERYAGRSIWIAGGAKTYRMWLPFVRRAFVTLVDYDGPADVFMPSLWRRP